MSQTQESVPFEEAVQQVEVAVTRLALLHLAFSRAIVDEIGEEKGKNLIIKAIAEYGSKVAHRTKKGFPDLPKYGVNKKDEDGKVIDCVLGSTFREYKEEELGCLYCYTDAAKSMAADPGKKMIHSASIACGDDHCIFEWLPTTEKERQDFEQRAVDWKHVDPCLAKGSGLE
jgi:hypothetical protein